MAPQAIRNGEGHLPVAPSAKLPFYNPVHADRVASLFHVKNYRVAIIAIQPQGVGGMGEYSVGEGVVPADTKQDIQIQNGVGCCGTRVEGGLGAQEAASNGLDPIDISRI